MKSDFRAVQIGRNEKAGTVTFKKSAEMKNFMDERTDL